MQAWNLPVDLRKIRNPIAIDVALSRMDDFPGRLLFDGGFVGGTRKSIAVIIVCINGQAGGNHGVGILNCQDGVHHLIGSCNGSDVRHLRGHIEHDRSTPHIGGRKGCAERTQVI